ncbi:MAG: PEP-CTERM sorting domain-containing protein [Puniceicoccales bacterium]
MDFHHVLHLVPARGLFVLGLTLASPSYGFIQVVDQQITLDYVADVGSVDIELRPANDSVLVVSTTFTNQDATSDSVQLHVGQEILPDYADLFQSRYYQGIGSAIYVFYLGDLTFPRNASIINDSGGDKEHETFSAVQLSGITLTDSQFTSWQTDDKTISVGFGNALNNHSFTIWSAGNENKQKLETWIPSTPDDSAWNHDIGSNHAAGWAYDLSPVGNGNVGFETEHNGKSTMVALNLNAAIQIPEPSTYALFFGAFSSLVILIRRKKGSSLLD